MAGANKTTTATFQQLAKEIVIYSSTTSVTTCHSEAQMPQLIVQHLALQTKGPLLTTHAAPPEYIDVFMDNFIILTQPPPLEQLQQVNKS